MILLSNLENRAFSVGLCSGRKTKLCSFRIYADKMKSEVEYLDSILQFFRLNEIDKEDIDGCILSSVVPSLTKRIQNALERATGTKCMVVSKKIKTGLALRTDNPSEVGSDLIANGIGALSDYDEDCLIVSLSTVLSFSVVTKKKEFIGCSLFPGLLSSSETMWNNCAQLMDIDLSIPDKLIGKSTKESMNSGIVGGYLCLIENFSDQIEREFRSPLKRILTGSDMSIVKNRLFSQFECNPDLTFDGLYEIYMKNKEKYHE